jgi:hypothetical protein
MDEFMQATPVDYFSAFKWIKGICAGVGVTIQAFSFFTHYAPPLFEAASLLTTAIAGSVIILTYYYEPRVVPPDTKEQKLVRHARNVLIVAVALLVVYMVMLKVCTVADPPNNPEVRYQIGFWTFGWSLNDDGKYLKQRHPESTPRELMDYAVAFSNDGPAKVWTLQAILASGVSMIIVFVFTFVLWVFGWSLLAKRKALGSSEP